MSTTLLAIDDCKITRQTVVVALRGYDCTVLEADDGVTGLAVASRERPDVILLDYKMPVMDGSEALARLRLDPDLKNTPVVMLTAESGRDVVTRIAKLGVSDYLLKPLQKGMLVEKLSRLVTLRAKAESDIKTKRAGDPLHILVLDDKAAMAEQIRAGLTGTNWRVTAVEQADQALGLCLTQQVDVVLANLDLSTEGAYQLVRNLQNYASTTAIPTLALCDKTAVSEEARARAAGFCGAIHKPIDCAHLQAAICRALRLAISHQYFREREGALLLTLPGEFHPGQAQEVCASLEHQLTATVEAGGDKFIVDLTSLPSLTLPVIKLLHCAIRNCAELSLKYAIVGSEALRRELQGCEEAKTWLFAANLKQAVRLLK
jgi:two-component system cell cycle response regulator